MKHKENRQKLKTAFLLFIIALLLECFFFNFRYWESLFYPKAEAAEIRYGTGLQEIGTDTWQITDSENAVVELLGIRAPVKSLTVDLPQYAEALWYVIPVQILATDARNAFYLALPETEVVGGITESQHIRLHLSGSSEKLALRLSLPEGDSVPLAGIRLNAVRPFLFRPLRMLVMVGIGALILLFRPSSTLYQIPLDLSRSSQRFALWLMIGLHLVLFLAIGYVFYDFRWKTSGSLASLEYNYLAESLRAGHTWLDFDPPEILAQISNPYDKQLRLAALAETGESYITDFAYFNGRYYCYFGVVPVILFYLPYLLLTGQWLSTGILNIALTCLFTVSVFWLVYELICKYFPKTSLGMYLLLSSVLIAGSEVTYCVQYSNLYSLPYSLSLLLVSAGLSCWLHASRPGKMVRKGWLIAGAICIALTVGCRPLFAAATLLAFPIFQEEICAGQFFSRKGFVNTLCVMVPFLLIDVWFLYYNYIRFGNPLDFGATYNLNNNDMVHKTFDADNFLLGFYEYFLQPFHVNIKFPYLSVITDAEWELALDYQSPVTSEPLLGGFFAYNMIGLFLFALGSVRSVLKEKSCYTLTLMILILGLLMAALDTHSAGITMRFLMDFSFYLTLATVLVILALPTRFGEDRNFHSFLLGTVVLLGGLCVFTNYFTLMASGRFNSLIEINYPIYYDLKYRVFAPFLIR